MSRDPRASCADILCNNLNSTADEVTYRCRINGARLQVPLNHLSTSMPSAPDMAVSVLRLTAFLGLLILTLTCQAGKYFRRQCAPCAVVSPIARSQWCRSTDLESTGSGGEGALGTAEKALDWETRGRSPNEKKVGFLFKSFLRDCMEFRLILFLHLHVI